MLGHEDEIEKEAGDVEDYEDDEGETPAGCCLTEWLF